jgi:hypothetical protein
MIAPVSTLLILIFGLWAALSLCLFRLIKARRTISPTREALQQAQESVHRKDLFLQAHKRHRRELRARLANVEAELAAERKKGTLVLQFFAEPVVRKHWFSSSTDIFYRVQVMLDGATIGSRGLIASNRVPQVDKKIINKKLEDLAKPFLEAGLSVSVKRFGERE